jgi:hypothetical protein
MKSQPLNMVFAPARLAPRTCSPSDRAGFVFSISNADTGCRNRLFDPPEIVAVRRLDGNGKMAKAFSFGEAFRLECEEDALQFESVLVPCANRSFEEAIQ